MKNYTEAGLERLYQAIGEQAEEAFLQALQKNFPTMQEDEKTSILNRWHKLKKKAEERLQSRGNE